MKPLLILLTDPYRSGTGDDPDRMADDLARQDVAMARLRGLPVWTTLTAVPGGGW